MAGSVLDALSFSIRYDMHFNNMSACLAFAAGLVSTFKYQFVESDK